MPDAALARRLPLADLPPVASAAVTLAALPPAARFIFRGREPAIAAVSTPLGFDLPRTACRAAVAGERAALWLGPDEWLIVAPDADGESLAAALSAALGGLAHSLVDVSHRQAALTITGPQAASVLNAGCPLDLDAAAFPVGMCTRTILSKCEIVLWRTGAETFRVEAWRSFLGYVWGFLGEASREFRTG
jgi:sarcosine oxidase, subunit gamma